ncbi:MAG TPA: glycolate oxidase subunit GlcE, partial [Chromatiales bacterium]|nr:glycolate oxidase subunit GlcE [Chromatiales bacterium]
MRDQDQSARLQAELAEARAAGTPLRITGGNSKAFYGRPVEGKALDTTGHRGIVSQVPTELVLTARAGTPLLDIEAELRQHGQHLPFEPPRFGEAATLGGTIACGLAGPRRPWAGAVRDHVLGCRVLTGQGDILHFGGEVMKNVAGYDIARLMCGALGTLGVLLEVSLKVLPRPAAETTRRFETSAAAAIETLFFQRQVTVIDFQAECRHGGCIGTPTIGSPDRDRIPA